MAAPGQSDTIASVDLTNQAFYGGLDEHSACLDVNGDGVRPVRFPLKDAELLHPDLLDKVLQPSGVHVRLDTDATSLRLSFRFAADDPAPVTARRGFPAASPVVPAVELRHLHELVMIDLFVNGSFYARRTNRPLIEGMSGNNLAAPAACVKKPLRLADLDAAVSANVEALQAKLAEISDASRDASRDVVVCFDGMPAGQKRLELYLPEKTSVRLQSLVLGGTSATPVAAAPVDKRPLLVTYGSSITQGMPFAHGASRVWPVVAGRAADLRVINMGYGGQCHMEQAVARFLRDVRADCFVFCLGINIHNHGTMSARVFSEAVIGFLATVRDGHPTTPICVVSPIWGAFRETEGWTIDIRPGTTKKAFVLSLQEMRESLRSVVELLRRRGDKNLHYVHGLDLIGEDMKDGFPDDLHPDGNGYERLGLRIAERCFGPTGLLFPGRVAAGTSASEPERPSHSEFVDWQGKRVHRDGSEGPPAKVARL